MATEDFTTYTEEDPNSRITVTSSKISSDHLTRAESAYVYKDMGAGHFQGDFTFNFTFKLTNSPAAGTNIGYFIALTNTIDDNYALGLANESFFYLAVATGLSDSTIHSIVLTEVDSGSSSSDTTGYVLPRWTSYYLTLIRDETVGTYGTLYLYIYSDSDRTTLLDTLTVTLNSSKKDFRYIMPLTTHNDSTAHWSSIDIENLELIGGSGTTPLVTTQACTNTIARISTGNGCIYSVGTSAVTQHGHVWDTSINPTTALDTKTENGASPNGGQFESLITGLAAGTKYYVRAYAVNTSGTSYGSNVEITTGTTIGKRYWWTEKDEFHWFDEWGNERFVKGTAVTGADAVPWWLGGL